MGKEPILEVRNLVTEFTSDGVVTKAVNDVSFTLHKGETIGIVGESGSGKSVTSLSIMRLIPSPPGRITGGQIIYHGQKETIDLLQVSEKEMQSHRGNDIAMIFQEPMTSLNPVLTCGEQVAEAILRHERFPELSRFRLFLENNKNLFFIASSILFLIAFVILVSGEFNQIIGWVSLIAGFSLTLTGIYLSIFSKSRAVAKGRVIDLFKQVKLPRPERVYDAYPHQLSGGQKQRVMIAMAMSCNPGILIADEPTTALDVTVQKTILDLMNDLQAKNNLGILFITHDLGVIAELADKVVVMYKGKIVEQGSVLDIFTNPQHPYTKGLLACRPKLNNRLRSLPTVSDFMNTDEQGNITETNVTIQSVIHNLIEDPYQRKSEQEKLYASEPILKVQNLKTWFPVGRNMFGKVSDYIKAVDDVTFDVYPGETLGLVGESGCGKTTLGRTILRLVEPHEGKITFQGKDITFISQQEMRPIRKDIQIIFQDPYSSLNPRMTIGEAIMEPMRVHGILDTDKARKNRVVEILERVNMRPSHFSRYPHEFSGGQRQRICIARAIALQPKFIICDESVSALDVSVQAQVLNLLNELKREFGFTYIFISHDLSVVKFMSDRMIVMNKGKIEELDLAERIYADPKSDYTRKLINAIPKGELDDIRKNIENKLLRENHA
ncbi:MAG TPA: ABC transporter ATP-binding protein [Flavobacteriales bacterium]|nr:ABC transporter ATP-binding protein [Flavobacteriales bacterium]HRJ35902.1 ABC transporter ATP-binding protein [Flavobacteriales bacterium]HRJ37494.1 ABC transporter ATP-binding protein [Flavobacteriales bacterium]